MKIAVVGCVGIEHKSFLINDDHIERRLSIGGAGWLCATTARRLGHETTIISRIGEDQWGNCIKKIIKKNHVSYLGKPYGDTQHFYSSIINGDSVAYFSSEENPGLSDIQPFMTMLSRFDVIIISYNNPEVVKLFSELKHHSMVFSVANLSGSIVKYVKENGISAIKGFDVVTMNEREFSALTEISEEDDSKLVKILSHNNHSLFVTSKDRVKYCINGKLGEIRFSPLNTVTDTTGAGDAFATCIAILLCKGTEPVYAVEQSVQIARKMCLLQNKTNAVEGEWHFGKDG